MFVCGNNAAAPALVLGLAAEFEADGVEAGALLLARYTEPLNVQLVQLGYRQWMGARIGATLLRDPPAATAAGVGV